MRAVIVKEPGEVEQLEVVEVPDPTPGPGDVLLDVAATALNRADLLQRRGLYPPPKGASEILGLECSGTVVGHGDGVDPASLPLGTRGMALLPGGGYATRVAVPLRMVLPVPDALPLEDAAAVPEAFLTADEALTGLGRVEPGDVVVVHAAAGGVGSAAVQIAALRGARVVATAGSEEKLALARDLGAEVAVNYKTDDFAEAVKDVSRGAGANVVLDFIGGAYWEQHARCLATGGRLVVIGVLGGRKATVDLSRLLFKRHQILGLVMRSRPLADKVAMAARFERTLLPHLAEGRLRPVLDRRYAISEVREAHQRMEANANLGKIVLTMH